MTNDMIRKTAPTSGKWAKKTTNKPLIFIFKPLSVTIEPLKIINEPLFQTNQGMSQADLGRSKTKDALLQDKITAFGKIWDILDPVWLFDAVNERN